VTVTYDLNSGAGAAYDSELSSDAVGGGTEASFIPDESVMLLSDDTIDVTAPAVAAVTSAITIYTRIFE
jgi:hypothetical protein